MSKYTKKNTRNIGENVKTWSPSLARYGHPRTEKKVQNWSFFPTHCFYVFPGICRRFWPEVLTQTPKNAVFRPRSYPKGPNHALEKVLTKETPCIWDTHGISGNVFANPHDSSSGPYPQELNPWETTIEEPLHMSTAEKSERREQNHGLRCQSGPSAKDSVILSGRDSSKKYGADQQLLQILIFISTNSPHQQPLLAGR